MAKFISSTKTEDRKIPAWLAANEMTEKLQRYIDSHQSWDIILAWTSGSYSQLPSDIEFPRASNLYTVKSIPVEATTISGSQKYSYTDTYEQEYVTTEKGDYTGKFSARLDSTPLGGDSIEITAEREPDKSSTYVSREYRTVYDTVTFAVEVKSVKRGNGEKIQALSSDVAKGKQMNTRAKTYRNMGKDKYYKKLKNKGVVIAFNIFTFLIMLVSLLTVAVLPEFRGSMGRADVQLELKVFGWIYGDPIPICALLGIDPEVTTWSLLGALVVLFIVELILSFPADDSTAFYRAQLFRYSSLTAVGCILIPICAILFFTWVDGDAGSDGEEIAQGFLRMLTFVFIVFLNLKVAVCLGAPVFLVWSFVLLVYNPGLYKMTSYEISEAQEMDDYVKGGGIEKYAQKRRDLLALYRE